MVRHLLVGILIGLLAGNGCAAPGVIVRADRGQAVRVDLQRVRPVEYTKEDLQKAVEPFANHLAAVVLQREQGLQLRLAAWSMPADPLQRALIESYLSHCTQRGQPGDCWEVLDGNPPGMTVDAKRTIALRMALSSGLREAAEVVRNVDPIKVEAMMLMWFAFYLASFIIPDVTVTKLIFVTMSASMIAFLGIDGFQNIIQGYRMMRAEAAEAQTFDQLRAAAERYGRRMGPSALRIATAIVTWGLCGATGMVAPASGLPGAAQAMANAETMGFQFAAVNGVSVAVSATGTATLVLAAEATLPEGGGSPQAAEPEQVNRKLSRNERLIREKNEKIDEYLRQKGRKVEPNPREGQEGQGRQGDRFVDGIKTEYKSLDPGATSSTIRNVVNASIRRGGQARHIIIDARGSGLSESVAQEGVARASGIFRGLVDKLEVIGDGFYIVFP